MHIPVQDLTVESFVPFGHVIEQPDTAPDAIGPGWQWWGQAGLLPTGDRPYTIGYLDLQPAVRKFDWAERHMHTCELVIPVNGDCLVYVGPPDFPEEPGRLPDFDRFQVFRVPQGQAVVFDPGVWHGAPLADRRPSNAIVLLLKDSGTMDNSLVRFENSPIEIEDET